MEELYLAPNIDTTSSVTNLDLVINDNFRVIKLENSNNGKYDGTIDIPLKDFFKFGRDVYDLVGVYDTLILNLVKRINTLELYIENNHNEELIEKIIEQNPEKYNIEFLKQEVSEKVLNSLKKTLNRVLEIKDYSLEELSIFTSISTKTLLSNEIKG